MNDQKGNTFRNFTDLDCWKKCRELRMFVVELLKNYPKDELYALSNNSKRAAYSTTNNIAEGYGRYSWQENIHHCRISRGSLYELHDQLIIALDNKYISLQDFENGVQQITAAIALVNGYIAYLQKQAKLSKAKITN